MCFIMIYAQSFKNAVRYQKNQKNQKNQNYRKRFCEKKHIHLRVVGFFGFFGFLMNPMNRLRDFIGVVRQPESLSDRKEENIDNQRELSY